MVDMAGMGEMFEFSTSDISIEHFLNLKKSPALNEKKKLEIIFERRGIRG